MHVLVCMYLQHRLSFVRLANRTWFLGVSTVLTSFPGSIFQHALLNSGEYLELVSLYKCRMFLVQPSYSSVNFLVLEICHRQKPGEMDLGKQCCWFCPLYNPPKRRYADAFYMYILW